jgi:hypothetical protein
MDSIDVVSLGSKTRLNYLQGQIQTWASHASVRNFFGFTEDDDFSNCSSTSLDELESYVETCGAMSRNDDRIAKFFTTYFGLSEGNTRSSDIGWVCAQRRLGRAFGWLHSVYHDSKQSIPDYLWIVDDDTFIDSAALMTYLQSSNGSNVMRAGCLFEKNDDSIPYSIPYGGFGVFLDKAAIKQLSSPIYCDAGVDDDSAVCSRIRDNLIGENDVFRDGMTLFELFYVFSATKFFCMHSDWLSGYILDFYLGGASGDSLQGLLSYPSCGNRTAVSGHVRHCTRDSNTCHNQAPQDMEYFALSSYVKSPSSYRSAPILSGTNLTAAMGAVEQIVAKKEAPQSDLVDQIVQPELFAYALMLGWSPSISQNKLYLDAVRVLIRSLRKSGAKADIVVIMLYHDPDVEKILHTEGAIVKLVSRIEHSHDVLEFEPWFVDIALSKLAVFEILKYSRVQFLDADIVIDPESSLDSLFYSFPDAKLVAEGLGNDSPLRAGWMMIKPSQEDYDSMTDLLRSGNFSKVHGWNYLDLPVDYPGWKSHAGWNFYGSSLEQGVLFHTFYAYPRSQSTFSSVKDSNLLKLLGDEELHQLGVYHFYGSRKPWAKVRARLPAHLKSARQHWLATYSSLDVNVAKGQAGHEYIAPLTDVGSELYSQARVLYGYITPTAAPTPKCVCTVVNATTTYFTEPV